MKPHTQPSSSKPADPGRRDAWDWRENPYYAGYHYPTVSGWYTQGSGRHHDLAPAAKSRRQWRAGKAWSWFLSPLKAG